MRRTLVSRSKPQKAEVPEWRRCSRWMGWRAKMKLVYERSKHRV